MGTNTSECSWWSLCSKTRSCVLLGLTQKVGPSPCMVPNYESYELRSPCLQFLTGQCDHVYCTTDDYGQTAPDDYCERFVSYKPNPYYCSRMNAFCPKAPTCYSETVEHTDTDCSEGMVLCTAVEDESDRVMYSIEDLENISKEENEEIPF